jgi:hypothetical protein
MVSCQLLTNNVRRTRAVAYLRIAIYKPRPSFLGDTAVHLFYHPISPELQYAELPTFIVNNKASSFHAQALVV